MQIQNHHFHDPSGGGASSTDDFLDQMLSTISPSPWSDLNDPATTNDNPTSDNHHPSGSNVNPGGGFPGFDEPAMLASKLRQHQITGGGNSTAAASAAAKLLLQQQLLLASRAAGSGVPSVDALLDGSPFKSPHLGGEGSAQALYNGFASGSQQNFHHPQPQNVGVMNNQQQQQQQLPQPQASGSTSGSGGGAPAQQPKQRVRARRGQATDPHSIAERLRRERIAERMKALQELVPNANKTDKASMLDEIIDYVKFLQLQVKVLSMSRLGGAAAVAPLVADMSSERAGGDCIQAGNGGALARNGNQTASSSDNLTVTEHQVAKLMEEDMGSAMQYLQGKGLCLMPISLATAISTATCHIRSSSMNVGGNNSGHHQPQLHQSNGDGPPSPNMSVLTVQSATAAGDGSVKDAASVSRP